MAKFNGLPSVRDDFRCSLCRQKNAFHCEHDTPYRDQLLGSYDPFNEQNNSAHGRPESQRKTPPKTGASSKKRRNTEPGQNTKTKPKPKSTSNSNYQSNDNTHIQQTRKPDNTSISYTYTNPSIKTHEQKKKGGCTIL